jgi:hypothetical protein
MLYGAFLLGGYCLLSGTPLTFDWSSRYLGSLLYLPAQGATQGQCGAVMTLWR